MLNSFRRRRKTGRNGNHNKYIPPTTETSVAYEDDQRYSPKSYLPSSTKSTTAFPRQNNRLGDSSRLSVGQDLPPALPPRKPLEKKNSVQMPSTVSTTSVFNDSSAQIPSTSIDETSTSATLLAPTRISQNKEISTSLVNLMGTATDSVANNNSNQNNQQDNRRISAAPSTTVDRLGLLDPLSAGNSPNIPLESPSSQRSALSGGFHLTIPSSASYSKTNNEFTWCYENSTPSSPQNGSSFDECLPRLEIDDKPLIYRQQFAPTEHFNWYSVSETYGPVIISYKYSTDHDKQRTILSIVRTRQGTSIESIVDVQSSLSPVEILRRISDQCSITDMEYFDPVLCDGTHDFLLKYDESHVSNQHKFGIIYQRENQLTEEDIFSNETPSVAMENFLHLIGTRVKLKDFRGFRGGLDVKSDQTGTESIYEQFQNHEIMFHVSTMLPYSKSERQQLERKRHIGNDIVGIVFQETETTFNPECITSQFLHVYLVVTPLDPQGTQFKISVIHRDSVPRFGPMLNSSKVFSCDQTLKNWILTKLINAEMASCRASTFQKYQERTKMTLFENLYRTLHDQNRPWMNFIFQHSQYKHECDLEQQQREEAQNSSLTAKTAERHNDNSLLGSVRRRFIAPKSRGQNSHEQNKSSPSTTILISTPVANNNNNNNTNDSRSKTRSMTMDIRRSVSRESITTNGYTATTNGNGNGTGRMTSFFTSSKTSSPRLDKSQTSRSLLDQETLDSSSSSRSNTKFLSPSTCPSSPWTSGPSNGFLSTSSSNDFTHNGDSYSTSATHSRFQFNSKSSSDDIDHDIHLQLSPDDLQSSSKDDLIKFVVSLQQQHQSKISQMDQTHSKAMKRLEMQLIQQQHAIDRDSP